VISDLVRFPARSSVAPADVHFFRFLHPFWFPSACHVR
jgi:hypothetical protein